MGIDKKNIIDFKTDFKKNEAPVFSNGLYNWMMFLMNFYSRVKNNLKIDFDSFMIMQLVVSDYLYKTNKVGIKNYQELKSTLKNHTDLFKEKRKVNIASIAEVLDLPRETVRRKIELLKKKKLINHSTKLGLLPTNKTEELMKPFAGIELKTLSKFLKSLKKNGTIDAVLNFRD